MGELAQLPHPGPHETGSENVTPRKLNLRCDLCGYGVLRSTPPQRCPMCQAENAWVHASCSATRTETPDVATRIARDPHRSERPQSLEGAVPAGE